MLFTPIATWCTPRPWYIVNLPNYKVLPDDNSLIINAVVLSRWKTCPPHPCSVQHFRVVFSPDSLWGDLSRRASTQTILVNCCPRRQSLNSQSRRLRLVIFGDFLLDILLPFLYVQLSQRRVLIYM